MLLEVAVQRGLDGALRADRHERRRLDHAVRRRQRRRAARAPSVRAKREAERRDTRLLLVDFDVKKLRVGVIYGGRSGEHEVSVASAASIFKHLDPARYERSPSASTRTAAGRWPPTAPTALSAADVLQAGGAPRRSSRSSRRPRCQGSRLDVVFPVLHGPYGEDGTVQGLLELANVPYVGAGVLGSAVGMDKAVMKTLFAARGLPIVPHLTVLRRDWERDARRHHRRGRRATCGYPGVRQAGQPRSSVGISKAKRTPSCADAMRAGASSSTARWSIEAGVPERPRDRVRRAGQRRPRGLGARARSSSPTPTASTTTTRSTWTRRRVVADSRRHLPPRPRRRSGA